MIDQHIAEQASASTRRDWIHKGKIPGPLLTALLQRPRGSEGIAAIRNSAGNLISSPEGIANIMASFFSGVSQIPSLSAPDQQEVLRALESADRLSANQASFLDSPTVTVEEVLKALARASPGLRQGQMACQWTSSVNTVHNLPHCFLACLVH